VRSLVQWRSISGASSSMPDPAEPLLRDRSPDYIASCCNEAGMRREAAFGKKPRYWLVRVCHDVAAGHVMRALQLLAQPMH
jgi:hypothetical protein